MTAAGKQITDRAGLRIHLIAFAMLCGAVFVTHSSFLKVPYFWDELGQFIPASLDILHEGAWIPKSTVPNVHPPVVMAYLALTWSIFGHSLPVTRCAMLLWAGAGLYFTFLLTIRMSRTIAGTPAFKVALLMLVTPLFFTQAMMAQLDMPAMTLTILALLLFFDERYAWCAVACTALVLVKETGAIAPALFAVWLGLRERRWRQAFYFCAPMIALGCWLCYLKAGTNHWFGDSGFAHYNIEYSLNPVRIAFSLLRRIWYLFGSDFRWIGVFAIWVVLRDRKMLRTREWRIAGIFFIAHTLLVSLLGGATLERYLLPVFPLLYIAIAAGIERMSRVRGHIVLWTLSAGMLAGFIWNPPYPFPYENNLAMVDFVQLQESAAQYIEHEFPGHTVATAWPFSGALYNPGVLYVHRRMKVVETSDFHSQSMVDALNKDKDADVLVVYMRTWEPRWNLGRLPLVDRFLRQYYDYEPQMSSLEILEKLGFRAAFRTTQNGQWIEIFTR